MEEVVFVGRGKKLKSRGVKREGGDLLGAEEMKRVLILCPRENCRSRVQGASCVYWWCDKNNNRVLGFLENLDS